MFILDVCDFPVVASCLCHASRAIKQREGFALTFLRRADCYIRAACHHLSNSTSPSHSCPLSLLQYTVVMVLHAKSHLVGIPSINALGRSRATVSRQDRRVNLRWQRAISPLRYRSRSPSVSCRKQGSCLALEPLRGMGWNIGFQHTSVGRLPRKPSTFPNGTYCASKEAAQR